MKGWVFWPSLWLLRAVTLPYFRVGVRGAENYPAAPFIAVVNHTSNLDLPVMAWAVQRPAFFLGKAELFAVPVLGRWLRAVGGIPVARGHGDRGAIDTAEAILRRGDSVYIAPEGTRKHAGDGSARPRTGFVRLAQVAGLPVVPIAVSGAARAMPPGAWFPRPVKLRIQIGEPMQLPPIEVHEANYDALAQQARAVMDEVYRLKAELDGGVAGG